LKRSYSHWIADDSFQILISSNRKCFTKPKIMTRELDAAIMDDAPRDFPAPSALL